MWLILFKALIGSFSSCIESDLLGLNSLITLKTENSKKDSKPMTASKTRVVINKIVVIKIKNACMKHESSCSYRRGDFIAGLVLIRQAAAFNGVRAELKCSLNLKAKHRVFRLL
jgi:hypothetical protein